VQADGQALERGLTPAFELVDHRHHLGRHPRHAQQVPHQRRVGGPDPGPGDGDLAQRLDRVGHLERSEQPPETGAREQVSGHRV
jgi:hypothetical protein